MRRSSLLAILLAAVMTWLSAGTAQAQATGTISGLVTDESGAVMPGVTIEVTNIATSQTRSGMSGAEGFYTVLLLPPGRYSVKATLPGFRTVLREGVTVTVESTSRVDVSLSVGQLEETVRVTGEAPLVETSSASLGTVIDEKKVVELPLNGRNFTQLGTLIPGVVAPPPGLGGSAGDATPGGFGAATSGFSVNGMRNQSNNFLLDGASNNDTFNTGFVMRPPPDAIQEFKIQTHSYSAEYGRNSGSVVNVVTKAGIEHAARCGMGIQQGRCAAGEKLLCACGPAETKAEAEPVRRQPGRADRPQPALRVRLLRRVPEHEGQHVQRRRAERRAADR